MFFFFFNDTATTEIYTLSLHDALPICLQPGLSGFSRRPMSAWSPGSYVGLDSVSSAGFATTVSLGGRGSCGLPVFTRSEEHTSELQSHLNLVCRLLLEKKKKI